MAITGQRATVRTTTNNQGTTTLQNIYIEWDAPPAADLPDSFTVQRKTGAAAYADVTNIASANFAANTNADGNIFFQDGGCALGTTYDFKIIETKGGATTEVEITGVEASAVAGQRVTIWTQTDDTPTTTRESVYLEWDEPAAGSQPDSYKVQRKTGANPYADVGGEIAQADFGQPANTNNDGTDNRMYLKDTTATLGNPAAPQVYSYRIVETKGSIIKESELADIDVRSIAQNLRSLVMAGTQIYLDWHRDSGLPGAPFFNSYTIQRKEIVAAPAAAAPAPGAAPVLPRPPIAMEDYADVLTITANAAGPPANDLTNPAEHWNAYWEDPGPGGARTDFNFYIDLDAAVIKDYKCRYIIKGLHETINYVNELTFDLEVKVDDFAGGDVGKILYFYCQIIDDQGDWNLRDPEWKDACVARLEPIPTTTIEWGIVKGHLKGVTANKAYFFCSDSALNLANIFGTGNFQNDFGGADQIYDKDTNTFGKVPVFPAMALNGVAGGPFQIDEIVEGQTSNATGKVQAIDGNNLFLIELAGTFQTIPAETVEGQTSNATGTLQSIGSPYVTLLLVPLVDGSYGYFWRWMHQEPKTGAARGKFSNYRRMVFLTTTQDGALSAAENYNSLATTCAHEFQHLIHGCYDPGEETWVDEGCSQFAQDKNSRADNVDLDWLKRFLHNPVRFTLNDGWVPNAGAPPHDASVQYIPVELWTLYLEKRFPLNNPAPDNAFAKMVDDPVGLNTPDKTTDADVPAAGNDSVFSRPDQPAPATAPIARPFDIAGIAEADTYRILFEDWVATNYFNKYNNGLIGPINPLSKVTDPAGGGGTVGVDVFNYANARTNIFKNVYVNPGLRGAINPPSDVTGTHILEAPAQTINITKQIGDFANIAKEQGETPDPAWAATPWSALNDGTMDFLRFRCAIPFHIYANPNDMHLPTTLNDALEVEGITGGDLGTISPHITNKYGGAAPGAPGHYACSLDGLDSANQPRKDVGGTLHVDFTQLTGAKRIFFIEERIESEYAILNAVDVGAGNDAQIEVKNFGEAGTDTQAVTVALPAHNTGYTPQYLCWVSLRPKVESITYTQAAEGTNPAPVYPAVNRHVGPPPPPAPQALTQSNDLTLKIKFDQEMKTATGSDELAPAEYTFREGDTLADLAERYYGDPALVNLITPAVNPPVVGTVCTFQPVVFYTVRDNAAAGRIPIYPPGDLTVTPATPPNMVNADPVDRPHQVLEITLTGRDAAHIQLQLHICGFGNIANDIMGPEETFLINFPATGSPVFAPAAAGPP